MPKEALKLDIFYRVSFFESQTPRPDYFSKLLCLRNFMNSFRKVASFATFHLICDGSIEKKFLKIVKSVGTVTKLPNVGNSLSFWHALQETIKLPDNHLVYFVEDDYLHCRDALTKLVECHQDIVADYITLYDHPVRYIKNYAGGVDWSLVKNAIYTSKSHHWRTVESTCMTFAAEAKVIKEDIEIFDLYVRQTNKPKDRELFRHLQGLGKYKSISPMKVLIGPMPSLATHCHEPWLAPLVNWRKIASQVK